MIHKPPSDQTSSPRGRVAADGIGHKRPRRALWSVILAVAVLAAAPLSPAAADGSRTQSAVVVANRGSGDISVIDSATLQVTTRDLPGDAEPMYVSHDRFNERVLVGDRANSTVVAFDEDDYEIVGSVAVGEGVFHQWLDGPRRQLWVVGDTSQTVTVVDTEDLTVRATIVVPGDIVAAGGKPHDVFVSGSKAFVTFLGLTDGTGLVVQYSTRTFKELRRITVGADPHVFVSSGRLYVASQGSSTVAAFQANDLRPLRSITVASAHGIFVTNRHEVLVTTIAGGGVDAVSELDGRLRAVRHTVDTDFPVPHNLTVDDRRQAFVTHSGATANTVSVIKLGSNGFAPPETVIVGLNPFGLAFVR